MITYLCKYTPLELLAALGEELEEPNTDVGDFREADALIHSSVCAHARMLLEVICAEHHSGNRGELVLTNCCDSVRRVADIASLSKLSAHTTVLDLPHSGRDISAHHYAEELIRLRDGISARTGHTFDRNIFLTEWKKAADEWKAFAARKEPFIAIMGARVSDQLRTRIRDGMPYPVIDLTCGGLRSISGPPEDAFRMEPSGGGCRACPVSDGGSYPGDDAILMSYASALLTQIPCTRMEDSSARGKLTRAAGLKGIVYHSVKFCDYYSFEYADLRRTTALPVLKIESDYTSQSEGQLDTRITAFAESLEADMAENEKTEKNAKTPASDPEAVFIGIDSGSTSTNVAAVDRNGTLLASCVLRTGARAGDAAERAYADVRRQLGARAPHIRRIIATGYGRDFIPFADSTRTEITCHARGAHFADPQARCVIDIGGQDSKVICLDPEGNVTNFVMNDKCAAGTGRFLEMMAHTLEMSMDEMSTAGLSWKKDISISSTCTVFAESEVVGLIAENTSSADIVHALSKSVALKTCGMVKRVRGTGPFMMTGGVARNRGVADEISARLGAPVTIREHPDLTGAIGAALYAADAS